VLLGAGYDTRAYGGVAGAGTTVFELDQPIVQAHKRSMLAAAHINCEHVNFVAIDFASDDLFAKLTQAGFDTTKKTLYLWEGVSLYLSAAEVAATLAAVQQQSAPNSAVVADLYAERLVKTLGKANANEKVLEMTSETLDFGLPFDSDWQEILNDFVTAQGMQQGETHFLGSNNKAGPYAVVVEMTC
jgi:methyltransferase (TIGR00027 family)